MAGPALPLLSPTDEGALEIPFSFPDDDATALVRPEASDTLCILLGSGVGLDGPLSELTVNGDVSCSAPGEYPVEGPGPAIVEILLYLKYISLRDMCFSPENTADNLCVVG